MMLLLLVQDHTLRNTALGKHLYFPLHKILPSLYSSFVYWFFSPVSMCSSRGKRQGVINLYNPAHLVLSLAHRCCVNRRKRGKGRGEHFEERLEDRIRYKGLQSMSPDQYFYFGTEYYYTTKIVYSTKHSRTSAVQWLQVWALISSA